MEFARNRYLELTKENNFTEIKSLIDSFLSIEKDLKNNEQKLTERMEVVFDLDLNKDKDAEIRRIKKYIAIKENEIDNIIEQAERHMNLPYSNFIEKVNVVSEWYTFIKK